MCAHHIENVLVKVGKLRVQNIHTIYILYIYIYIYIHTHIYIHIYLCFLSQIHFGNPGSSKGKSACVCLTAEKFKTLIMLIYVMNLQ